ncbi:MAG: PEP-CTERM sorting domain-containing protein [Fimbriiglobus sp.]
MRKQFLAAVVVAVGVAAPAPAQIGVIIGSGPAGGVATARRTYFINRSVDVVALTEIIVLSQNPLNAGLVRLLADGIETNIPLGVQTPVMPFAPVSAIVSGSPSPYALELLALGRAERPDYGGGSRPRAARAPDGMPLLAVATTIPENGNPGSVAFTLTDPAGDVLASASLPVPDGGWWVIGLDDPIPPPDPDPDPGPKVPGSADTPEPATALLAGLGVVVVAVGRRRVTSACA